MHVVESLGQDVDAAQMPALVQALEAIDGAEKRQLEQQRDHAKLERPGVLDEFHGAHDAS